VTRFSHKNKKHSSLQPSDKSSSDDDSNTTKQIPPNSSNPKKRGRRKRSSKKQIENSSYQQQAKTQETYLRNKKKTFDDFMRLSRFSSYSSQIDSDLYKKENKTPKHKKISFTLF
jgi:rubrerythrin